MAERFTEKQLADYRAYEAVRQSGAYNMFDPRVRMTVGMERADWLFVMKNYEGLQKQANEEKK